MTGVVSRNRLKFSVTPAPARPLLLNASFVHLGFALGTELGVDVVAHGSVTQLGLWGGAGEVLALILILLNPKPSAMLAPI